MMKNWKLIKRAKERLALERGTLIKDHGGRLSVALVYPNTYELGMSNLGLQTVYGMLNGMEGVVCERLFMGTKGEMGELLRTGSRPFTIESQRVLTDFHILAFTLPFEDDYVNIPTILYLSGIKATAAERDEGDPLIMAGGCGPSLNPEPLADLMDLFLIGEGEGAVEPLFNTLISLNEESASKEEALRGVAELKSIYVPSYYSSVSEGGILKEFRLNEGAPDGAPLKVHFNKNLKGDFPVPVSVITTPDTEFSDTTLIEAERGCGRGCRFCVAGFLYMPPRYHGADDVVEKVIEGLKSREAGGGKVGLVGAAVSEHPALKEILKAGIAVICNEGDEGAESGGGGINRESKPGAVTLSSIRAEVLDDELLALLREAGYRTLTIAPEAGSERMRRVVNKDLTDDYIIDTARRIGEASFRRVKLYFLIGLPGEEDDDAAAIGDLAIKMREAMGQGELILSVNQFIPKPFTPFQFHPLTRPDVIERRFKLIKELVKGDRGIMLQPLSVRESLQQAYIARGGREAGRIIIEASRTGWKRALKGVDLDAELYRVRGEGELFPWEVVDLGLKRDYLYKEYLQGLKGAVTPECTEGCRRCGIC